MTIYQILGLIRLVSYITSGIILCAIIFMIGSTVWKEPKLLTNNIKAILILLVGMVMHFGVSILFVVTEILHEWPEIRLTVQAGMTSVVVMIIPATFYLWYVLQSYRNGNGVSSPEGGDLL